LHAPDSTSQSTRPGIGAGTRLKPTGESALGFALLSKQSDSASGSLDVDGDKWDREEQRKLTKCCWTHSQARFTFIRIKLNIIIFELRPKGNTSINRASGCQAHQFQLFLTWTHERTPLQLWQVMLFLFFLCVLGASFKPLKSKSCKDRKLVIAVNFVQILVFGNKNK